MIICFYRPEYYHTPLTQYRPDFLPLAIEPLMKPTHAQMYKRRSPQDKSFKNISAEALEHAQLPGNTEKRTQNRLVG